MNSRSSNPIAGRSAPEWEDSRPPFSTWNRLYAAVIIYTLVIVAALYWMTVALNR
jgi:polyferredoxin